MASGGSEVGDEAFDAFAGAGDFAEAAAECAEDPGAAYLGVGAHGAEVGGGGLGAGKYVGGAEAEAFDVA